MGTLIFFRHVCCRCLLRQTNVASIVTFGHFSLRIKIFKKCVDGLSEVGYTSHEKEMQDEVSARN